MSRTAERICAKFARKSCLVSRSDEFECQGQRSKVKVTRDRDKKRAVLAANDVTQQLSGVISATCMRCMFDKTSLALVRSPLNVSCVSNCTSKTMQLVRWTLFNCLFC